MIIDYNNCFWGDSTLDKIEIEYDKIKISVFNDIMQKEIYIDCFQCAGITEIITWDEVIIENIFLNTIFNKNSIISTITQLYDFLSSYDSEKNINGQFYELKILLINGLSFSIICKKVVFRD